MYVEYSLLSLTIFLQYRKFYVLNKKISGFNKVTIFV